MKNMRKEIVLQVVLTYFAIAFAILLSGFISPRESAPIFLSIILLIPLCIWYKNYSEKRKLSMEIHETSRSITLFLVLGLFALALFVRIPSVLLLGSPYEKTPLIYLIILTITFIERTDGSVFGFKIQKIVKSLFYGLAFYAFLGLTLLTYFVMVYAFSNQMPIQSYNITPFLLSMPFMTLCVGISEEGLFRGYMQTHLEKVYTKRQAIFIQAIFLEFGISPGIFSPLTH